MEFKAELKDGKMTVKPIIVKDDKGNVTVHLPSFQLMNKLSKDK